MKKPFLCHVIFFGQLYFKRILALKSPKLLDTTEAKKKKDIYIMSVPKNKDLPGIKSYQKKGTWQ